MSRKPRERGQPKVLVIDDEPDLLELLELTLSRMGLDTTRAQSVAEAIKTLDSQAFDLCLTDMRLPDGEGLRVVEHITEKGLDVPVAVITAFGSAENAVAALKAGAFDYLAKPVALEQLRALVKQALKVPEKPAAPSSYQLLGESPAIMLVRSMIDRLSRSQAPVFITGESGSGKELAARMIHLGGPRSEQPFVPVNCGAIPENLMESEFFGYKKGAFTGAEGDRDGFFQAANNGTLFLDEVADLPLTMQVKLLRAIQEKKVRKVGATTEEPVDVRIISATHKRLPALVDACPRPAALPLVVVHNDLVGDMSDHHAFRLRGVPYLFLSCGRWAHYHRETDTPDRLAWGKMALIRDYVVSLAGALADADLAAPPVDTTAMEIRYLEAALGPVLPAVLKMLRMSALETRADLARLAFGLQMLGV